MWTHDELTRIADICRRHRLFVISDEIHCEFSFPDVSYTPFATVAHEHATNTPLPADSLDYCVCISPSKAFNIAGLQCANIFVPDPDIRTLIDKAINIHEVCDIGPIGMTALIAAYNESEDWLNELQMLLFNNYKLLCTLMSEQLPQLPVTRMEGTYLAWVDVRPLIKQSASCPASLVSAAGLCERLAREEHLLFNSSQMYGTEGFIRINLATSEDNIRQALSRFKHFAQQYY